MPAQTFTSGQELTAAELTSLVNLLLYPVAETSNFSAAAGNMYHVSTSSTVTCSLPTASIGQMIGIKLTSGGGLVEVAPRSGSVVLGPGCGSGVNPCALGATGAYVVLVSDGSYWHIVAGALDTGWVAPTLGNSWASVSGLAACGYRQQGNVVRLQGTISGGASASTAFTLPTGMIPYGIASGDVVFPSVFSVGATGVAGEVQITSAGAVQPISGTATDCRLDGITFTVD